MFSIGLWSSKVLNLSIDDIKKLVSEIYENYGIDTDDMTEEEMGRICDHYHKNNDDLKKHLKDSRETRERITNREKDE